MKKLIKKIKFWLPFLMSYVALFALIGLSLGLTYMIATSNMPDWLKWWLL